MKIVIILAVAASLFAGIPMLAQDSGADTSAASPTTDSAKVTYAPKAGGFGDLSASHAWEMSPVAGELDGKLDSKTARVGDRVVLKTLDKVQTSDGTVIPRGSRVVGHVTEVQAYDPVHGTARIAIAFDHAQLKNGQSIAIYTLIGGVVPGGGAIADLQNRESREDDGAGGGMMGMPVPTGAVVNGGRMDDGHGGGGPGGATNSVDRASDTAVGDWRKDQGNQNSTPGSGGSTTAQAAGGSINNPTGAHAVAAARAVPHRTQIPGVLLAGNSSSSGVLLSLIRNIQFESGTLIQLGVATGN
jgi:hypothetical protein